MSDRSCSAGEATPESARRLRRWPLRILSDVTDRLVELDRLGRGRDMEAVLLDRRLDLPIAGIERGVGPALRGASDAPRSGRPDRLAPVQDEAA